MTTFKNTFYDFTVSGTKNTVPAMAIVSVNTVTNLITLTNGNTITPVELAVDVLEQSGTDDYFAKHITVTLPLGAPTNGALTQTAAGALAAATYYVRTTWVTATGAESVASAETSLAVLINNVLNVAAPASPPAGAVGWNVYVSVSSGTETKQNATVIALATPWVEPTTGLVAGAAVHAATAGVPLLLMLCNIVRMVPNFGTTEGATLVQTNGPSYYIREDTGLFNGTDGLVQLTTFGSNAVTGAGTVPVTTKILVNPRYVAKQVAHALSTALTTSAANPIGAINVLETLSDALLWSE